MRVLLIPEYRIGRSCILVPSTANFSEHRMSFTTAFFHVILWVRLISKAQLQFFVGTSSILHLSAKGLTVMTRDESPEMKKDPSINNKLNAK